MMHRNPLWIAFLCLIGLYVMGYTIYTGPQLYHYLRLTEKLTPQQIEWSVAKLGEDAFAPETHYTFSFGGKTYQGQTIWHSPYLNAWAGNEATEKLKQSTLPVWFDPSSPQVSTMDKHFPVKPTLYLIMLWGLLLYFIGLGRYVIRFNSDKN